VGVEGAAEAAVVGGRVEEVSEAGGSEAGERAEAGEDWEERGGVEAQAVLAVPVEDLADL